jgi:PAS domain S-box-containing protein
LAGIVLQHVQTAAMAVDDDGRVGVYNPAAARVLGVPAEAVAGRPLEELTDPPALAALVGVLAEARRSGAEAARRQVVVALDGAEQTLGYTVSILGEGGAAALFFADLTDALAEERRRAEAQRFAEVGRIAGAMTHELKSPLATVELYANLLLRRQGEDDVARQQLRVIKDQTRECLDRLRAIMHSINPDAASRAEGTVLTALVPLVRDVVEQERRRFDGAEVRVRLMNDGPRVALREADCRSVVTNLVANALEVTGGKGPVDVGLRRENGHVALRVADRGPGLPSGDVFAAFFSTKASGTGLGLWLVRSLVEAAGGTISAGDRRGGGAEFVVTLPVPDRARLAGASVLVVEDDPRLREAETEALVSCDAVVTAVGSGRDVPRRGEWQCAVLDFQLPGQSGVDIAKKLPDGVPVLLASGCQGAGGALAEVCGRQAWYLPKPFEVGTLLDLVSLLVVAQ